ncbi:MAG: nickel pincer cofactor biosynthesis protein LarB [gamma proteobacterium endosymbiont of Lamellibrachia anaximandri]|nr:nickel pincer cofactor biosynthesis protein LarB [gamma proteobacterium endosymbiont of Lamellibrachia anaximandri]MBL3617806.1 nickel pincer cofactor biosynthesis protein LarB [gamma proteobacterium endosymbiont of Lamellibrachia anaximandri]
MSKPLDQNPSAVLDFQREKRIGLSEAVFCARKSPGQIANILARFEEHATSCLLTRLDQKKFNALPSPLQKQLDYDSLSSTAFFLDPNPKPHKIRVAIVSGGTSDASVCAEAARTLAFYGVTSNSFQDVGVTGLWRLLERLEEIQDYPIVITVAGMEGAIFSVLGGLIDAIIIAVPTSVSYGIGSDGELALHAALGSCAPGLVTVNIDNGYGAACSALRIINKLRIV